jgi:hypothetical protein
MSPTPQELELGAKAYQRVRLYEKHAARNARQMPWILGGCTVLFYSGAFHLKVYNRDELVGFFLFVLAAFLLSWAQNRMAKESYANQKMILQLLEEKYGDALPWVVEEMQLAAARQLEAEIAHDRQASRA